MGIKQYTAKHDWRFTQQIRRFYLKAEDGSGRVPSPTEPEADLYFLYVHAELYCRKCAYAIHGNSIAAFLDQETVLSRGCPETVVSTETIEKLERGEGLDALTRELGWDLAHVLLNGREGKR